MRDLLEIRDEIDEIDSEIVRLYEKRMKLAGEVADYKIRTGKPVFDKEREIAKLDAVAAKAGSWFTKNGVRELFQQIMSTSRKRQYQLLTENGKMEQTSFSQVDKIDYHGARIVFQGVEGAYSQQAMRAFFGEHCDATNVETWKDAMEAIQSGEADYAVLPIENSSAGIVSENYDLLLEYDNYMIADQIIRIDHALLALPGTEISDIKTVYSHPQALMQCSKFLDEHREFERISLKNTALAAMKVRDDGRKSQAAIASELTADIYGLEVLEEAIQNNKQNATRFIIVTGRKIYEKDAEHISICFETTHESGSLYHMLSHIIYNGVNMTKLQARPVAGKNWEYRFFVDIEGRLTDTAVVNALRGLKEETIYFRILGTY